MDARRGLAAIFRDVPLRALLRMKSEVVPLSYHPSSEADMTIGLGHYLVVAAILFTLGIFGIFLNRKNVIVILMSIELILLAVNINLVAFSAHLGDLVGQVFALFVLTVAAAEAAIGLAILVVFFRNRGSIAVEDINLMKG
jgi:NADH-quinone oxidoreductase subunit K